MVKLSARGTPRKAAANLENDTEKKRETVRIQLSKRLKAKGKRRLWRAEAGPMPEGEGLNIRV